MKKAIKIITYLVAFLVQKYEVIINIWTRLRLSLPPSTNEKEDIFFISFGWPLLLNPYHTIKNIKVSD